MKMADASGLWLSASVAGRSFEVLNLDHPAVTEGVLQDMTTGVAVYYDTRWRTTDAFCRFLSAAPQWVADKTVLILGAGIGLETLLVGSLCGKLYVNDLAPGALQLCLEQLRRNGMEEVIGLPGRYETLNIPPVDLLVGCFLVYNGETAASLRRLLKRGAPPLLLMNDNLPVFRRLLRQSSRDVQTVALIEDYPCVLFT